MHDTDIFIPRGSGRVQTTKSIMLHGRHYLLPTRPTVVVCIDGFDPEYLEAGCQDGILPTMTSFMETGFYRSAKCAMPSLTNPNNVSIITGAPTIAHGVAGNSYIDRATGEERLIMDDSQLRGSTILKLMADSGVRVAAITAEDKLRKLIKHGLSPQNGATCFSAETASECSLSEHGIENVESWLGRPAPVHPRDQSFFVLDAGLKLLQEQKADLLYLALTDYIQRRYIPRSPEANAFFQGIDERLAAFVQSGAVVIVTGDHGMSTKSDENGDPNILFLEDILNKKWSTLKPRILCPIAEPFDEHHCALGGFVRVYLDSASQASMSEIIKYCQKLPEVEAVYSGQNAAALFNMPLDREGDLVVIAKPNAAIGSRKDGHDLRGLEDHPLRTHGGLSEQDIPLLGSMPSKCSNVDEGRQWRNFDAFEIALNH